MFKKSLRFWQKWLKKYKKKNFSFFSKEIAFFTPIHGVKDFASKYHYFSSHPLIGKVSTEEGDVELVKDLLVYINDHIQQPHERLLVSGEVMTKVLAYRDLKEGMEIPVPLFVSDKEVFRVDRVFDLWNGMPAFGLVPKKKNIAPILLFRGTDFSFTSKRGIFSIVSDMDLKGPGYTTYFRAKESIDKWLESNALHGKKSRVLGFSLGGALAAYTLLYSNRYISEDPQEPSLAFHPPGVSKKIFDEWQEMKKDKKLNLFTFMAPNDMVSKVGHLLGKVHAVKTVPELQFIDAHVVLFSSQERFSCLLEP